jgi:hypothetical protein
MEGTDYFYIPISVSFSSPSKRSFLLLVNKLSITSNQSNIALLNEFFFYLLNEIKQKKSEEIKSLMKKYLHEFTSSSDSEFPMDLSKFTDEQKSKYSDLVI